MASKSLWNIIFNGNKQDFKNIFVFIINHYKNYYCTRISFLSKVCFVTGICLSFRPNHYT